MRLGERHEVPLNYDSRTQHTQTCTYTRTALFLLRVSCPLFLIGTYRFNNGNTTPNGTLIASALLTSFLIPIFDAAYPDVSTEKRRSKTFPRSIRWKSELAFSLRGFPELRASRASPFRQISLSLSLSRIRLTRRSFPSPRRVKVRSDRTG